MCTKLTTLQSYNTRGTEKEAWPFGRRPDTGQGLDAGNRGKEAGGVGLDSDTARSSGHNEAGRHKDSGKK